MKFSNEDMVLLEKLALERGETVDEYICALVRSHLSNYKKKSVVMNMDALLKQTKTTLDIWELDRHAGRVKVPKNRKTGITDPQAFYALRLKAVADKVTKGDVGLAGHLINQADGKKHYPDLDEYHIQQERADTEKLVKQIVTAYLNGRESLFVPFHDPDGRLDGMPSLPDDVRSTLINNVVDESGQSAEVIALAVAEWHKQAKKQWNIRQEAEAFMTNITPIVEHDKSKFHKRDTDDEKHALYNELDDAMLARERGETNDKTTSD